MRSRELKMLVALAFALLVATPTLGGPLGGIASAQGLEDDGGAEWRLEQPAHPKAPPGVAESPALIGLGKIGDIEFAPRMTNRGALITSGIGRVIPSGVWEFNGVSWHELSEVCGGSDGRVIWAGPEEFWTIANGRSGQQANIHGELPPTRDNTLCRFSNANHKGEPMRVMESFAFPAFEADSYQAMNAGACLSADDCWFAGEPLPSDDSEAGSFHLHWDGHALSEEPYPEEGYPVESMQEFEGRLYEGVRISEDDRVETTAQPAPLHVINPEGATTVFEALPWEDLPLYETGEYPSALDFLHLSAAEEILWAAAGPQTTPEGSQPGQVTIARDEGGGWLQLLGPEQTALSGKQPFPEMTVTTVAAEPGAESAWFGLDSPSDYAKATSPLEDEQGSATEYARVARIAANGELSAEDEQTLPGSSEVGTGAKGAAFTMTCPGPHDCWLATTRGWLFHLSTEQERKEQEEGLRKDADPAFETLITERPADKGLPLPVPVSLADDDSGLPGELTTATAVPRVESAQREGSRVTLPLLSHVRSRLLHGDTLELRFRLAVKARLKLIAKRDKHVVAATAQRTLAAGNRSLKLRLDPKRWPTKLTLQQHALAPLPTETLNESNETTVTTSLEFPNALGPALSGPLQ
jgi:hypothetical protein